MSQNNRRTGLILLAVVVGMIGLSFASVPFYRAFCRLTGLDGTTQRAAAVPAADKVIDRLVTVRFNTDVQQGLDWTFVPATAPVTVKLGEPGHAVFKVTNNSRRTITGMATYNVTPEKAGLYFNKVQCFCFDPHELKPGETKEFPVLFFVDPALNDDPHAGDLTDITLSYTYFEAKNLPEKKNLSE